MFLLIYWKYKSIDISFSKAEFQMRTMIPIFFISYILARAFLSRVRGLWVKFKTRSMSSFYLFRRMISKIDYFIWLLARFMLLTPLRNSIIFSKPAESKLLLHSFNPFILWDFLAKETNSTTFWVGRLQPDRSKKSVSVFFLKSVNIF